MMPKGICEIFFHNIPLSTFLDNGADLNMRVHVYCLNLENREETLKFFSFSQSFAFYTEDNQRSWPDYDNFAWLALATDGAPV